MGIWAGFFGPGDENNLKAVLGGRCQSYTGAGFGLGVDGKSGEPATLTIAEDGGVSAGFPDCDGAGSSASIDPSGQTLTLTRDPFGFHGLYTTQLEGVLWYASDLRALQRLPGVSNRLEASALHGYLCFSYVPAPLTMTPGIAAAPAGERIVLTPNRERRRKAACWREAEPSELSEEHAVAELRERLREAVAQRVGPDPEVGVFLSGGIDSSIIAALLVELGVKVHLFTLDFGPPFDGELTHAQKVAEHLGQPLNVVLAHPEQVREALIPTAAALDQPFGDGITLPLYLLGQAAAKHVGVIFNGEGGDQLFGGWTNKPMIAAELYAGEDYDREEAYLKTYHRFYGLTGRLYTPHAEAAVGKLDVGRWVRPALNAEGFTSLLHRLRAANLLLKGAQNILPRATQLAEAHGLWMRAPFFDRALTDWTFTLPANWFLHGACEKYLLKRAAEPYLPPEIVWR
jgi:asparagine synthase (glutamine-hydrolysing)